MAKDPLEEGGRQDKKICDDCGCECGCMHVYDPRKDELLCLDCYCKEDKNETSTNSPSS